MKADNMRQTAKRGIAAILCIVLAFGVALTSKKREPRRPPLATDTVPKTPNEILSAIPRPTGDSLTEKAIKIALDRARKAPADSKSWVDLGDSLAQRIRENGHQTADASIEEVYRRALQLAPGNSGALVGLAWVAGSRHLFEQSINWAKKAVATDPGNPAAYGLIGDAELELGQYERSLEDYQKMMDLRPDLSSYSRGGYLLWLTGHRSKAIWLMEKAIRAGAPFAENTAWCRARLALMLFNDGALVPAWQTLQPALAAAPRNLDVLLAAGRILTAFHNEAGAKQFYERALAITPNIEALTALGDLAQRAGRKADAESYYKKTEALQTTDPATVGHDHLQMERFYAEHDRNLSEALRMAEQQKLTRNVLHADILAWVYFKCGEQAKAEEAMQRALRYGSLDPATQFHAGLIAARGGNLLGARRHLIAALSYNPQFDSLDAALARQTLDELAQRSAVVAAPRAGNLALTSPQLLEQAPTR